MELVTRVATAAVALAIALAAWILPARAASQAPVGPVTGRTLAARGLERMQIEDLTIDYFTARPEGEGTWPGVILGHEGWGISEDFKDVARRLAEEGFVVMVPDLNGGKVARDADKARELGVLMDESAAVARIDALASHLKYRPEVGDHRVGLVGFDAGGRAALLAGMVSEAASCVVIVYGRPVIEPDRLRRIGPPVLGIFGGRDPLVPRDQAEAFREALAAASRTADVRIYDEAGRGFMNAKWEQHDPAAAADAWSLIVAFLRDYL